MIVRFAFETKQKRLQQIARIKKRTHYYLFYDFRSLVEPNETHTNAKR